MSGIWNTNLAGDLTAMLARYQRPAIPLDDKSQTMLDLTIEVAGSVGPVRVFNGSYVVLPNGNS